MDNMLTLPQNVISKVHTMHGVHASWRINRVNSRPAGCTPIRGFPHYRSVEHLVWLNVGGIIPPRLDYN